MTHFNRVCVCVLVLRIEFLFFFPMSDRPFAAVVVTQRRAAWWRQLCETIAKHDPDWIEVVRDVNGTITCVLRAGTKQYVAPHGLFRRSIRINELGGSIFALDIINRATMLKSNDRLATPPPPPSSPDAHQRAMSPPPDLSLSPAAIDDAPPSSAVIRIWRGSTTIRWIVYALAALVALLAVSSASTWVLKHWVRPDLYGARSAIVWNVNID